MPKQPRRKTRTAKVSAAVGAAVEEALSFESPESSSISSASYDPVHQVLTIWFKRPNGEDNKGYDFAPYRMKDWTEFLMSASKGGYFARCIRPFFAGKVRV